MKAEVTTCGTESNLEAIHGTRVIRVWTAKIILKVADELAVQQMHQPETTERTIKPVRRLLKEGVRYKELQMLIVNEVGLPVKA